MPRYAKTESGIHYARGRTFDQAVVFIHGFLEDLHMWDGFIHQVPEYSVIKIDLPGFGQSAPKEKISIPEYADGVKEVLDKEGIQQVILVGHSMGGYTALAFAEKYPEMVKGLSLFHSQPYPDSKENKAKRLKSATFVETHGGQAYSHATIPNLFAPAFVKKKRRVVDDIIKQAQQNSDEGIIAAIHAMRNRKDTTDVLKQANYPVQFIIGTEDAAIPAELSLRQTTLPDMADVHILKKVGHMGHLESPRKTANLVRNYIEWIDERTQGSAD